MNENNADSNKVKLITLGNSYVGKTSFIFRYIRKKFTDNYFPTIGFDRCSKEIRLSSGAIINLSFYDTAGQERYRSLAPNFIKIADGILLMYDITDDTSFKEISNWIESVNEAKGKDFPILLIGNKVDLEEKRKVSKKEGEEKAKKNGYLFMETSCKDNINIEESVNALLSKVIKNKNLFGKKNMTLENKKQKKKKKKNKCFSC